MKIIKSNLLLTVTFPLVHSFHAKNKKGVKTLHSRATLSNAFWFASSKSPGSKKVPLSSCQYSHGHIRTHVYCKQIHIFLINTAMWVFERVIIMCVLRSTGSRWGAVLRAEPGHPTAGEENPLPHTFLQPQSHTGLGGGPYTVSALAFVE